MADLKGVYTKIDRAKTHLDDFNDQVRPIEAACKKAIVRECDEQRSEYVFRLDHVPDIPANLSAILGDAIHNLRVSLDHLMWQLVIASKGSPDENTSFPLLTVPPTPNRYGRSLPNVHPGIPRKMRMVLDEVQPYKRSNPAHHELAIIDKLDIRDKHRELLIAVMGSEGGGGFFGDAEFVNFNFGPYNDGDEVARFTCPPANSKSEPNISFFFAVRFDEPAAGPWGKTLGASKVVRNSLRYIEDEVLPRFRCFF